jgi:serine phosphatase RsbU (regulator of sigma subunit)
MDSGGVGQALDALFAEANLAADHQLPALARRHVASFGGLDITCYLVDLQQLVLVPFLGSDASAQTGSQQTVEIEATIAGRVYQQLVPITQQLDDATSVVWLPLVQGAQRLGVAAVTVAASAADDASNQDRLVQLRGFVSILSELIITKSLSGDAIVRLRRTSEMGLAAEMQWALLPPLAFESPHVALAAMLEPAYHVAGDSVDYAVDAGRAHVAIYDAMGHGIGSVQLVAMAVAAYRNARRSGRSLPDTCLQVDDALLEAFDDSAYTTAIFAELDTTSGMLSWVSAGHPEPLLLRQGKMIKSLHAQPRPPLGIALLGREELRTPHLDSEQLQPEDSVLFYTDGVTEARSPDGDFFGEQRLTDLVVRNLAAGLSTSETMRRVVAALLDHRQAKLSDDATLLLLRWPGPEPAHK